MTKVFFSTNTHSNHNIPNNNTTNLQVRIILGPANVPQITVSTVLLTASITIIVCTTLAAVVGYPLDGNSSSIRLAIKKETNSAVNILQFKTFLFENKTIIKDDWVIFDNAKIHYTASTLLVFCLMADTAGAHIRFQLNYSSKLNVTELVHGYSKNTIQSNCASEFL